MYHPGQRAQPVSVVTPGLNPFKGSPGSMVFTVSVVTGITEYYSGEHVKM